MLYNLANEFDKNKVLAKLESLIKKGAIIELTEKTKRSSNLNKYMHVCFGLVAIDKGYTMKDVKQDLFKCILFPDYYVQGTKEVFGRTKEIVLSTADTPQEILTDQLTKFRNYAAMELQVYIPSPEEHRLIELATIEIEKQKQYL